MPAIYAHFRLGEEVREELDGEEARAVELYPELFQIGTHGPDILFYYRPLTHNAVSGLGHRMHAEAGGAFFSHAAEVLNSGRKNELPADKTGKMGTGGAADTAGDPVDDLAALSYIYGFLCHFALDVSCHGYIGEYITSHGVSHAKIESELDRELMVRDGFDPVSHSIVGHLVASDENARVISRFYAKGARKETEKNSLTEEGKEEKGDRCASAASAASAVSAAQRSDPEITEKEIKKALRSMIFYSGVLLAPSHAKRAVLNFGMNIIGATGFQDMMIGLTKDPQCEESTGNLMERYEEAKLLALRLIRAYRRQFLTKEEAPDEIYGYNFESQLPS